ncbi:MAG: hypothetical protein QW279_14190, partial [Candidatus Jordarchaeaceae archaeon]
FPAWSIGDYQVKKLPKSNILIYKISSRIVLALDSYEKEGVLIIIGKRLEESFTDSFKELERLLPAAPSEELAAPKEPSITLLQGSSSIKETRTLESTKKDTEAFSLVGATESLNVELTQERTEQAIAQKPFVESSSVVKEEETIAVSFPVLFDSKVLRKVKDPIELKILQLCDGGHTVDDIAEELKIPKIRVMLVTGDYGAKGILKYVSGFRKLKR